MNDRWQTILAIDFDRWAAATYAANFPGVRVECGPVADHLDALPAADVVIGGPPCQPFSQAGKRKGDADERDCVPDFIEAVRRVRPRMFLMENVAGLMSFADGRYAQKVFALLSDTGYAVEVETLDAVSYGVPQFRSRCWWWGIRSDLAAAGVRHRWPQATHVWPAPVGESLFGGSDLLPAVTVGQALGLDYDQPTTARTEYAAADPKTIRGPSDFIKRQPHGRHDEPMCTLGANTVPLVARYDHGVANPDQPAPTIKAGGNVDAGGKQGGGCPPLMVLRRPSPTLVGGSALSHTNGLSVVNDKTWRAEFGRIDEPSHTLSGGSREPVQNWKAKGYARRLTPDECLRLQSAPDDFRWPDGISKTNRYKVAGNGWASRMGAVFSEAFAAADPDSRTVIDLFCGGGLGACGWAGRYWTYQPDKAETGVA